MSDQEIGDSNEYLANLYALLMFAKNLNAIHVPNGSHTKSLAILVALFSDAHILFDSSLMKFLTSSVSFN
jgi:hypothetical protein